MENPTVYLMDIRDMTDPVLSPELLADVSGVRRKKILRMRRPEDRKLSLAVEKLLCRALTDAGFRREAVTLAEGPQGKPFFPEIASRFQFNLSHSGEKALCVRTLSGHAIGCDIQQIGELRLDLAKRFFHPNEYDALLALPDPETQRRAFSRYWALKESFIKCTGEGLSRPLNSFEIRIAEDGGISVLCPEVSGSFRFGEPDAGEGYACAWCLEE